MTILDNYGVPMNEHDGLLQEAKMALRALETPGYLTKVEMLWVIEALSQAINEVDPAYFEGGG